MDRVLKYLQSTSESTMNVITGIIIIVSMKIFMVFEFYCPCLPGYNRMYGLGIMFLPPLVFFLIGVLINKYTIMVLEEVFRPPSSRLKNWKVIKRFVVSMMIRALAAPIAWILISLLDGKFIVCAFSESVDPEPFQSVSNATGMDIGLLLAKIPCKTMPPLNSTTSRKAAARYLKFLSQAIGWSIVLFSIFIGALARLLGPLFSSPDSLQTRYWACYTDMEEKFFEEACVKQNYAYAEKYMKLFFESSNNRKYKDHKNLQDQNAAMAEKSSFYTTSYPEHLMKILDLWCKQKPPIMIKSNQQHPQNGTPSTTNGSDFAG